MREREKKLTMSKEGDRSDDIWCQYYGKRQVRREEPLRLANFCTNKKPPDRSWGRKWSEDSWSPIPTLGSWMMTMMSLVLFPRQHISPWARRRGAARAELLGSAAAQPTSPLLPSHIHRCGDTCRRINRRLGPREKKGRFHFFYFFKTISSLFYFFKFTPLSFAPPLFYFYLFIFICVLKPQKFP